MKTLLLLSMILACGAQSLQVYPTREEIRRKNFPFVPYGFSPDIQLDITYFTKTIGFKHCCKDFVYMGRTIKIDRSVWPTLWRHPVEHRDAPRVLYRPSNADLYRHIYVLLMVDPDVPSSRPTSGTREKPRLHWIVTNVTLATGRPYQLRNETLSTYSGPKPPDPMPHHYVFLLYKQESFNYFHKMKKFVGDSRAVFDIKKFTKEFGLTLRGISWFQALNDAYTNHTKVLRAPGDTKVEAQYCSGKKGWTPGGCVTAGAGMVQMTLALFLLPFIVLASVLPFRRV